MVKTQYGGTASVRRISAEHLNAFDEQETVYVPRSTITSQIVRLQNQKFYENTQEDVLDFLMNLFNKQNNESSKQIFVKMSVKTVNECFENQVFTVYIDKN